MYTKQSKDSYRDLPIRLGETSTLFRNEDSGEMHGLTRVRQFTISEGHLIVRPDQMVKEFKDCIALAQYCLQVLGVEEDVTYHLSKWDPTNKEKYIGEPEVWGGDRGSYPPDAERAEHSVHRGCWGGSLSTDRRLISMPRTYTEKKTP